MKATFLGDTGASLFFLFFGLRWRWQGLAGGWLTARWRPGGGWWPGGWLGGGRVVAWWWHGAAGLAAGITMATGATAPVTWSAFSQSFPTCWLAGRIAGRIAPPAAITWSLLMCNSSRKRPPSLDMKLWWWADVKRCHPISWIDSFVIPSSTFP